MFYNLHIPPTDGDIVQRRKVITMRYTPICRVHCDWKEDCYTDSAVRKVYFQMFLLRFMKLILK